MRNKEDQELELEEKAIVCDLSELNEPNQLKEHKVTATPVLIQPVHSDPKSVHERLKEIVIEHPTLLGVARNLKRNSRAAVKYLSLSEFSTPVKKLRRIVMSRKLCKVFTFEDIFELAVDWADLLPHDFDCIIGVPRSGLIIANVIANKMNKPLSTPDDFLAGRVWSSKDCDKPSVFKRVLLVEDAVAAGRQLLVDYERLKLSFKGLDIKTASLFCSL